MAHLIITSLLLSLSFFCSLVVVFSSPIEDACKASLDAKACKTWLSQNSASLPKKATALDVIQLALNRTTGDIHTGSNYIKLIYDDASKRKNLNRTNAAVICNQLLGYSTNRVDLVHQALTQQQQPKKKSEKYYTIKDARAWLSAVLVYESDCWSALKYVNDSSLVVKTMGFFNDTMIAGTSSALAMLFNYDIRGKNTKLWSPPKTERDGFWDTSPPASPSWATQIPKGLRVNVTVCPTSRKSKCKFTTVNDAVKAAPDSTGPGLWFVIYIMKGVYKETVRIGIEKRNVVFLGDGIGQTVITGSKNVQQPGVTTYDTATLGVAGDRFMASNLTIENTAGSVAHQAVAFRSDSDMSVLENCEIIGNQDTLYTHSLRQFYGRCRIQGNVDFIFGNAAAYFEHCEILVAERGPNPRKEGENNVVTAQGRTDPAQSTGFVFKDSVINGTKNYMDSFYKRRKVDNNSLGRPWKMYSRTVFIECTLEALISPEGWMVWKDDFALSTLYYGEYNNRGTGSDTSKRVKWSRQIPKKHVQSYSLQNFIQAKANH